VTRLETRTKVLFLQHPRESKTAIGTAKIAHACLPSSELHVGLRFGDDPAVRRTLDDPSTHAVLLYPGPDALVLGTEEARKKLPDPLVLVVIDGTWPQSKKVLKENPWLGGLPRVALLPPEPSEYRIRREPREDFVSTLESVAQALGAIEGNPSRFEALYAPFRAMVDTQIHHESTCPSPRQKRARPKPRLSRLFPEIVHAETTGGDFVCVTAEANAYPYDSLERTVHYPDELVHWLAVRVSTGEVLSRIVAPSHPLAPSTPSHTGLSEDLLQRGTTLDACLRDFASFVRPGDTFVCWGTYATNLFRSVGGTLPGPLVDLRFAAKKLLNGRVGTLDECLEKLGRPLPDVIAEGRAGLRGASTHAVFVALLARVKEDLAKGPAVRTGAQG
jgi:DTW domain-containing protein YfiP